MDVLLDNSSAQIPIREPVAWQLVRHGDDLQWAVSIHVPLARCEAVINVGVAPSDELLMELLR